MRVVLRCVVICALLLFQQCASEVSETLMTSQSYAINGTFLYLNTSTLSGFGFHKCPQTISIEAGALMYESPTSFSMNLAGLKVTTVDCTYGTEGTNFVELSSHNVSFGSHEPTKSYTIWNMTLPENTLKCKSQASAEPFSGGMFTFMPVPVLQESLDMPSDRDKSRDEMKEMKGKVDYLILLADGKSIEVCPFFPAAQYSEIKKLVQEKYQDHMENDDVNMRIGSGKFLKFCTICECGEKLGTDLDLNSIEMKEDQSTEMPTPQKTDEKEQEDWRPPEVLIKNQRCPVAYSNRIEEVVNEDYEDDEDDEKKEARKPGEGNQDAFKETKKLVLYAVVNKLYEEFSSELGEELDNSGFDMRRTIVSMMTSFRRRRVMFMKKGGRCGSRERPIDKDTVFLYEKKHILRQLYYKKFISKNLKKVSEILGSEEEGVEAFTLHVLQKNTDGRFSACALSNSKQACSLLNQNSFCESFKPLGSRSSASSSGPDKGSEGGSPQQGQGPGGSRPGQGNSGSGPPSTGAPPSTGIPPSNGGTTATGRPVDNPNPPQVTDGSTKPPPAPGQGNGETPPPPEATNDQEGSQESPAPSPSPTPVNATPTPSAQPSNSSSSGLCFPASSKVELDDGRIVHMEELKVGESISDGSGGFSKVILFTHAAKNIVSEFVRLETDMADIVLSAQHYLPVNGRLMTGESAKVGDTIIVLRNGHRKEAVIKKIERVWMRGLFNPQTTSGSIAVSMDGDAVIASTYTAAVEPNVAHSLLAPLRMLNYMIGRVVPWSWFFENGADKLAKLLPSGSSLV